jgi:metallo-beta-lactamase class B
MIPKIKRLTFAAICCVFLFAVANGQTADEIKLGIAPVEPFRIAGNIYYVGSSDATSYLVVTPKGNIIIDSGMKEMVPQVTANIVKLGFKLSDTKIILNSHAHFDHAGGIAELRRQTGAQFWASELDSPLLQRGGLKDPNFADRFPFEPTTPDSTFRNGKKVRLGGATLTANVTPGHTPGCTTWTTTVRDGGKDLRVIFVCSVSSPGYQLVGNAAYPNIESDYRGSFEWFKKERVDIFLGSHAGFFDLEEKRKKLKAGAPANPFIDPVAYREFIDGNEKAFIEKLNEQKAAKK